MKDKKIKDKELHMAEKVFTTNREICFMDFKEAIS